MDCRRLLVMATMLSSVLSGEDKWLRLQSRNFELYTDAGPSIGRDALRRFEQIRHVFETRTQSANLSPLPVRIFVFKSEPDFRPYQVHESAAGYYQGGQERDYIAMQATGPDIYRVVFHEYVHLVLRHAGYNVPVWFNEGTSELYSTLEFKGSNIRIGDLIPSHISTLKTEKMLDIPTLMTVDHQSPHYNERGKTGIFYAESWALAHMLNFSPEYQPGMANFVAMMLSGEAHRNAFQRAFGKSEPDVLKDLTQYIRRDRFVGLMMRSAPPENIGKIPAAPVTGVAPDLLLADLLLAIRKDEAAAQVYERVGKAHGDLPEVEEALGDLDLRRNQDAAAQKHYERALQFGSRSARLHYDYAMLLRESSAEDELVWKHLREAVELDPKLFDAHHIMGYLSLREQRFSDAVEHLKRASTLQPFRSSVWEYLALAYHYSGRKDDARLAATNARRMASSPEEVARTEATLELVQNPPESIVRAIPSIGFGDPLILAARVKETSTPEDDATVLRGLKSDSRVEGTLMQTDCLGSSARLHVVSETRRLFLLVKDPGTVFLKNAGTAAFNFACGPVPGKRVLVEYNSNANSTYGTAGDVTSIEFR